MFQFEENNPYKILDIPESSSIDAIKIAYKKLLDTYQEDQASLYSLIDNNDRDHQLNLIKNAYKTITRGAISAANTNSESFKSISDLQNEIGKKPKETEVPTVAWDGPTLKTRRESLGLSLEILCQQSKINKRYLKAIESNDRNQLPATVYLRGFITEIARALNLPVDNVVRSYLKSVDDESE